MRCRYHDRGLAVQVAIDDYETQATLNSGGPPSLLPPWLPLESALGAAWREKLAEAGVRAAAQDLVALHLTCGISGGHRAFWDWMAEGSSELARSGLTELRTTAAKSLICTQTAEPANLETACYWNLFEDRWAPASGPILVSLEMRSLQSSFFGSLSRWGKLLTNYVAYAEEHRILQRDPAAEAHYRAEIRRLIAAGCAAALPAGTLGRLRARADKGPTRTIASLVADVR